MSNTKLWSNFTKGDKKALAILFHEYYDELFNYGKRLSNSKNIAEDCLQDLFLKLWVNRKKLPTPKNLKAFLLISLRNLIIDTLRFQQRLTQLKNNTHDILQIEFSVEDILIKKQLDFETREFILKALNQLSSRQKEAIYLRYFDGLDIENIATVMDINIQSARNCIHRGILSLRQIIALETQEY